MIRYPEQFEREDELAVYVGKEQARKLFKTKPRDPVFIPIKVRDVKLDGWIHFEREEGKDIAVFIPDAIE